MSGGHLISASDRDLMKRITIVLALVFLFTAAFSHLYGVYSHKFLAASGDAQWIWAHHRMSDNYPVAFFAVRDFMLPEKRYYTRLKIVGDPEYTLWVNGREIAGRRVGLERTLDLYDISNLVKTGPNRIMVAVRAPHGVGGLIASIDIAPETLNWLVTDGSWKIFRTWRDELPRRDPRNTRWEPAMVVGRPPIGRWNYLSLAKQEMTSPPATVQLPREMFPMRALFPRIRAISGVAVQIAEPARATAFDFGFTQGRVRIIAERPRVLSRVVHVRFAYERGELGLIEWNLRPMVLAPGERVVTTPEAHNFRYVMVFGRGVRAEVVR